MDLEEKVIVITGATSGIGLATVERILLESRMQFLIRICILCRNMNKGEALRSNLLLTHKSVEIELMLVDIGDVKTVIAGAKEIRKKYNRIDYLFLNAGILPLTNINLKALFSWNLLDQFRTGENFLVINDKLNELGIPNVFTTNVLGHFILVEDLLPLLVSGCEKPSKIIWTTSRNAVKGSFSMEDIMCRHGHAAYGSSKYVINRVSVALNERHNEKGIHSYLAEPGLVSTSITDKIVPVWMWMIVVFFFRIFRIFSGHFTISPYNGSEAMIYLFKRDTKYLNVMSRYDSAADVCNNAYVEETKLQISISESNEIFENMKNISQQVRDKLSVM